MYNEYIPNVIRFVIVVVVYIEYIKGESVYGKRVRSKA